jgi:hypothetical protein
LCMRAGDARDKRNPKIRRQFDVTGHVFPPRLLKPICVGWFDGNIIATRARIAPAWSIALGECLALLGRQPCRRMMLTPAAVA